MKNVSLNPLAHPGRRRRTTEDGSVRSILLPLICFALGVAVSAMWTERPNRPLHSRQPAPELSESSKAVLSHLPQPVEVRFYSILDASAPASLVAFSQRAGQLLSAFQRQSGDKIALMRFDSPTNADPNGAAYDGIRVFNTDKGQDCFLGATFSSGGKKEVLAQLSPEWESALEADVGRALQRLGEATSAPKRAPKPVPSDASLLETIKTKIPDPGAVSLEEGIRILREDSVKEFAAATGEMQSQVQAAQARVLQAKSNGSPAEQDAAIKELQAVQSAQAERLKEIAANSQARVDAFKQLKTGGK